LAFGQFSGLVLGWFALKTKKRISSFFCLFTLQTLSLCEDIYYSNFFATTLLQIFVINAILSY